MGPSGVRGIFHMSSHVTVYFATGNVTWRKVLASWRRPRVMYLALAARTMKALTREKFSHCAIGVGCVVLDKQMSGPTYWPLSRYLQKYPTLDHAYVIPSTTPIDLNSISPGGPIRPLRTLIKLVSNGRFASDDCVCLVRRVLDEAGIPVPRTCTTPGRLDRWLSQRAFRRVDI